MSLPFEWVPIDPFLPDDVLNGQNLCFSPELGRMVFIASTISYYSDNGTTWNVGAFVDNFASGAFLIWNASQSKFYTIVSGSDEFCFSSTDGINWTQEGTIDTGAHSWTSFICDPLGTLYALDSTGNVYISNSGGTAWTNAGNNLTGIDISISTLWTFMVRNPTSGLFTVFNIGAVISIPFATSPDGVTWTGRHGFEVLFTSNNDVNAAAYNPSGVLVALTEISAFIMTSNDGINWTKDGSQLPNWGVITGEQVSTPMLWSANENVFVASSFTLAPTEATRVFTSADGVNWVEDSGVIPSVPDEFSPPAVIDAFGGLAEAPDWERFFLSIVSGFSLTPVITSPPYDNSEITGDQELEIEDVSLLALGNEEILGDLTLGIMLSEPYEIIGDLTLEIELIPRTVWSSDASGLYILVPNKTEDTIYDREGSEDTQDVAIPDPIIGTAYVGG